MIPNSSVSSFVRSVRIASIVVAMVASVVVLPVSAEESENSGLLISNDAEYRTIYSVTYGTFQLPLKPQPQEAGNPQPVAAKTKKLLADLYLPNGDGPFPTILMVHGGAWFSGSKSNVALHARHAAESGYAVVAINYRLAPTHKFPAQLEDCQLALRWIAEKSDRFGFDTRRVAAYGYSAGAHLACLLAMKQDTAALKAATGELPQIRAVVAGGTPCEFSWVPEKSERLAFWLGDSRARRPDRYIAASPVTFVDKQDPPVFLFHGKTDRIVPLTSAQKMMESLSSKGVPAELHVIADADHLGAFINVNARKQAINFLNEQLGATMKAN